MRTDTPAPIRLADYKAPDFAIDDVHLTFDLQPENTRVHSRLSMRRTGAADAALRLDGERLKLISIALDGKVLSASQYQVDSVSLTLLGAPDKFTLDIETEIAPASNTALEGLYMSSGRYCTQCEAEGFRKITYFLDRPDVLARYTVRIEANKTEHPTLLANGNLIDSGDLPDGKHFAIWRDPFPKPCYLFALVAGKFDAFEDSFTTQSGRKVALAIYVDPGSAARAAYAMDSLKRSMRWDEEVFQREYDLDIFNIVAVRDFNFGAMENKGLNVFNSAYVLADPNTATDADYGAIESVIAHEYFHNWTGNRITCRDWFQLCLKEGLTVFRDQEFSADQRSRPVQRIKDVRALRARQFAEDSGPLAHPVRPNSYVKIDNFYTATVYEKGAELIRMLKALLGDDGFNKGIQLYFDRCDGTAATIEDFLTCFAEASGRDLSGFKVWYEQAGAPRITINKAHDLKTGVLELTLSQATPPTPGQQTKKAVPIPIRAGLVTAEGAPAPMALEGENADAPFERTLVLDAAETKLRFTGLHQPVILSLLRGFSAPVVLEDGLSDAERLTLMAHDPDAFVRWESGDRLARASILKTAEAIAESLPAPPIDDFIAAFDGILTRASDDPAFAALALRLPEADELMRDMSPSDPTALVAARRSVREKLAQQHRAALEMLSRPADAPFSPDAASAGRRALKNAALELYAALDGDGEKRAMEAYEAARNMTDQRAALEALSLTRGTGFDEALARFLAQWQSEPLVVDKWFAVQAGAPRPDALERVRRLAKHPEFDIKTPNRARALLAGFAQRNVGAFHAPDGSGYEFYSEHLLAIDKLNPALSARLLGAFESWRVLEPKRAALASAALERLADHGNLSKNALEVANRALGRL
ncbi:MAG: aminopeptidase N [Caulobacterales bacterium]